MTPFEIKGYHIAFSFFLDLIIGDPRGFPHPVSGIGKIISIYEEPFRRLKIFSEKVKGILFFLCGKSHSDSYNPFLSVDFGKPQE